MKFEPLNKDNPAFKIDGSMDMFDSLKESNAALNSGIVHSQITRYLLTCNIIQYQSQIKTPRVLDYGCGAGTFNSFWEYNYRVKGKKQIDYLGLETTDSYIKLGNELRGNTILKYDANNDDIRSLALNDPDIILMQQFIEHIDQRAFLYLLDFTHEQMRDDSTLIISAPSPKYESLIVEHHHDYEYTYEELESILNSHGFTIEQRFGWVGFGVPKLEALTPEERKMYDRLLFVSQGYANSVLSLINPEFAPYYYLKIKKT